MMEHECFYHIHYSAPWDIIMEEWTDVQKEDGLDRWEEYGNDISFRTVREGRLRDWTRKFEQECNLPERDTDWQFIRFGPNSNVPIHRDPKSLAWIALTVLGFQPLEFYNMDKEFQFQTYYQFALVNSKMPHYVDVKGKERVLLRKIFKKTDYDTLFQSLNCVLSPLKSI